LRRHRKYFREEVEIVQPAAVVVMGETAWDVPRGWRLIVSKDSRQSSFAVARGRTVPVIGTVHPAATRYRRSGPKNRARLRKDTLIAGRVLREASPGAQ